MAPQPRRRRTALSRRTEARPATTRQALSFSIFDCRLSIFPSHSSNPADRQSNQCAADVDQHISQRSCSRAHEPLMKFIAHGNDSAGGPSSDEGPGTFPTHNLQAAQRPPDKSRENCILSKMTKLTQSKMNRDDCRRGDLRSEPA